ncbi:MAG: hypothetical protein ACTS7E_04520 [Arsenophonus sp. NC-CH8-MAG3]
MSTAQQPVIRNGYLSQRIIRISIGDLDIKLPKVNKGGEIIMETEYAS